MMCPGTGIIRAPKSSRIRWVSHLARMGDMRNTYKILAGKSEGKRTLEYLGIQRNITIILRKHGGKACIGFIWLRIGTNGGLL